MIEKVKGTSNLDKIAAEIGFLACDIYKAICSILSEQKDTFKDKDYAKFKDKEVPSIISKIQEKLKINNKNFVESIFSKVILERIESNRDREKAFKNLINNLPKFDPKELERVINKALGILIEDGLFAYAIWLESEGKDAHKLLELSSLKLLKDVGVISSEQNNLRDATLNKISTSIEKTMLARQLLERMLVYARYRAKAIQKGE